MRQAFGKIPSIVLAMFLALGFATIWGILIKWGHETVRSLHPATVEERPLFLADGTPVVERYCFVNGQSIVPPDEQFRDLEGNPAKVSDDARWATGVSLHRSRPRESLLGDWLSPDETWDQRMRRLSGARDPI